MHAQDLYSIMLSGYYSKTNLSKQLLISGSYTLIETDGTKRVVEYEADDKNGFNAVVHKIGTPKHEEPSYHKEPEYHVKEPSYKGHEGYGHETAAYGQEYGQFDDGFVPSFGH